MPLSKNEIKAVSSLAGKKEREKSGLFVVEGVKMVEEALASSFEVKKVYRIEDIGETDMKRISSLSSPSPALAVVSIPGALTGDEVDRIINGKPLALALDAVRDPGNLGTIMRIADWFGIDVIFASRDTADIYNPKVVQATMGAIFRKRLIYCDLEDVCRRFALCGMPVYGTFLDGETISSAPLSNCGLIVMGNEANGISPRIASMVTRRLFIPPFPGDVPTAESLNVAVATAITCYEFRR